ncbi:unnamed protein product [marine sediment metagenome]|uniref:Uncharacterized protein n=1 Tax=marine sediment metagenome TaxID=412755 RepID=X1AW23_9ZZZZ
MIKFTKFYPRDLIAIIVLICAFALKTMHIDGYLDVVIAVVIAFYFSKRLYEEKHPNNDLGERVKVIEAKFGEPKKPTVPLNTGLETTGDFKPTPTPIRHLPTSQVPTSTSH